LELEKPEKLAEEAKKYATLYGDSFLWFYQFVIDKSLGFGK
jgi:hypothetical protein